MSDMIQKRERQFQGVKFNVDRLEITTTDGKTAVREVVVHNGAVVILAIDGDGQVVMIRNHRFTVGKTLWELPAGTLEVDEDPVDCALRELIEETGYRADDIEKLCTYYSSPGISTEQMHCYLARGLTQVGQKLEETELITVEPLGVDRVMEMIRSGEIEDAKTIATLLYYMSFVK